MLKSNPIIKYNDVQEGVYVSYYSFQLHEIERSKSYISDPEFPTNDVAWCYGVCDGVDNLLEVIPELLSPDREFIVLLTEISKYNEPNEGGWRWRKWGDYIGTQTPTTEYIYDEPIIDLVYCYHIYEKINEN